MTGLEINISVYQDEEALLEGLKRREPDACACMVKRFAPLVFAHACRIVKDTDEAEEVLQTTFIKACEKLDTFEGRSAMSTWLYRIATNEALMRIRSQKNVSVPLSEMDDTWQPDDMPHNKEPWSGLPTSAVLDGEVREVLEKALQELPEGLRLVFTLRELQSLSTEETAQALNLSTSAVKVRLHRARLRLRELLAHYFTDEEGEAP